MFIIIIIIIINAALLCDILIRDEFLNRLSPENGSQLEN